MKKMSKIILCLLCTSLLAGCNSTKEEKLDADLSSKIIINEEDASAVCFIDRDYSDSEGYVMGAKFVIYTDDSDIVTRVVGQQVVSSNNKSKLTSLKTKMETSYETASQYGGYKYDIKLSGKELIIDTDIDYTKLNLEEMAQNSSKIESYLNDDNQYTLSSIQAMYMETGAECTKK